MRVKNIGFGFGILFIIIALGLHFGFDLGSTFAVDFSRVLVNSNDLITKIFQNRIVKDHHTISN